FSRRCGVSKVLIHLRGFEWMNSMIIVVRLRQIILAHQQRIKAFATTQLKVLVHLDRLKWANFDTNLAAHANRDIDVENLWVKLLFTHIIGLLVIALNDINALRWTFLFTNLAGDAAQTCVPIFAIKNEDRQIPVVLRQRHPHLRILHCYQTFVIEITPDKVSRGNCHSLEYARANHCIVKALMQKY